MKMSELRYNMIDPKLRIGEYFVFGSVEEYEADAQICLHDEDGLIWSYHSQIDMILLNGMHRKFQLVKELIFRFFAFDQDEQVEVLEGIKAPATKILLTQIVTVQNLRNARQELKEMPL